MKYGIYFAYWTKEWFADYKKYMDKVSALGFDVLEISCAALRDVYTTKEPVSYTHLDVYKRQEMETRWLRIFFWMLVINFLLES